MSYWRFDLAELLEQQDAHIEKAKADLERMTKRIKDAGRRK